MARHVFHVFPVGSLWEVTENGLDHILGEFPQRNAAIAWAMEQARRTPQGQLRIYRRDHTLAESITFEEDPAFFEFG